MKLNPQRLAPWYTEYGKTFQKYFSFLWRRGVVLNGDIFFPRTRFIVSGGKSQLFFSGCKRKQGHTTCYSSSPTILIPLFWVGWKHLKHTTQIRTQLLGWYWRLSKTFLIHFLVCKPQEAPTLHCFFPTCLVCSSSFLPSFLPLSFTRCYPSRRLTARWAPDTIVRAPDAVGRAATRADF